jgi:hypothetical protein
MGENQTLVVEDAIFATRSGQMIQLLLERPDSQLAAVSRTFRPPPIFFSDICRRSSGYHLGLLLNRKMMLRLATGCSFR